MLVFLCFLTLQKLWNTSTLKTRFTATSSLRMFSFVHLNLKFIQCVSLLFHSTRYNEQITGCFTTHNSQNLRFWWSTEPEISSGEYGSETLWPIHLYCTRTGNWVQFQFFCSWCVQLCHHCCSGHGWFFSFLLWEVWKWLSFVVKNPSHTPWTKMYFSLCFNLLLWWNDQQRNHKCSEARIKARYLSVLLWNETID